MLVPARMQQAIGSSRRLRGMPVRELRRLTTGMNRVARAWLCMIADMLPTIALIRCETRVSTPPARRRMNEAALPSRPVRSRPAPMIMTAISDITALPAKPSNSCSTGIRRVTPMTTMTSRATRSPRTHSRTSMSTVNTSRPSTRAMSVVRVRLMSIALVYGSVVAAGSLFVEASGSLMDQVPDAVAEADPALLEMGLDAPFGRGRV